MKVISTPITFLAGRPLTPEDLNSLYLYGKDAVSDVAGKRWTKAPLLFPFCTSLSAPYTETSGELLSYRFTCPVTCVVERGFLHANMTSVGEVKVDITVASTGATPAGCSVPWLSTKGAINGAVVSTTGIIASSTLDVQGINVDRFVLDAGVEYKITVSSAAAFVLSRFDVTLHLAIDRWTLAGTTSQPAYAPALFTDASSANAVVVADNNTALSTQAALFAGARTAPTPMLFVRHGFNAVTTTNLLRQMMPVLDPARARASIMRGYIYAVVSNILGNTITCTIRNAAAVAQFALPVITTGLLYNSADSGALNLTIEGVAGDPAVTANDWRVDLSSSSLFTTCTRAHVLLWVARSAV